jgi:hypothetical protein
LRISTQLAAAFVTACAALWLVQGSAHAQDPGSEESGELPVALGLVEQSTWVEPGGNFRMTLGVEGDTGSIPDDASVSAIVYPRLLNRRAFSDTLVGEVGTSPYSIPVTEPVEALEGDRAGQLEVAFDSGPEGASLTEHGVYPLELRLTAPDGEVLGSLLTHLLLQPEVEFAPLDVGVVVEMGGPPAQQPDESIDLSDEQLTNLSDRTDLLRATDQRLSVAPVPETLDSLDRLDEPGSDELLEDMGSVLAEHQLLARPYVDVDLETWVDASLVTEVSSQADQGAEVFRDLFGIEPVPDVWLTGGTVGAAEAATWRELGMAQAILPSGAVAEVRGVEDSITPLVDLPDGPPGFVSDDVLVERLVNADDPIAQQRFIAELAMIWFERPGESRAVMLRLPSSAQLDPDAVAETLDMMGPSLSLRTVTDLFAEHGPTEERHPTPVTLTPKEGSEDLSWMPQRLQGAKHTMASLSGILSPDELAALQRSLLIAPGAQTDNRRAYIDRVDDAAGSIAEAIHAPDTFRITLTDREGVIPLTITNELDEAVPVRVQLSSNQLEFLDGNEIEVEVPPGSERFDVRVQTRTSGAFPLHITLTSLDGEVILDQTTFDVRSTAISGVGLLLSIGAGLFLVLWWFRHWRRSRREVKPS